MKSTKIAVALIGARAHYAVPRMLYDAGMLACLYTDAFGKHNSWARLARCVPKRIRPADLDRMLSRRIEEIPHDLIHAFSWFGIKRGWRSRFLKSSGGVYRRFLKNNVEFSRLVAGTGLPNADAVYTYNAAGLEILAEAKRQSMYAVMEQIAAPFAVEEGMVAEERELWPGWESRGPKPSDWQPLFEREQSEWELADAIACGSQYVVDSMRSVGGPVHKCAVVPYGIQPQMWQCPPRTPRKGPLRVLFSGTVCLRKGIQYLMRAAELLPRDQIVIRAVGPLQVSAQVVSQLEKAIEILGPVPRREVIEHYKWADILVLPALSEGSANVCYEALAAGLPVITTPNAGSVIQDGQQGFIVPIRDHEALAAKMHELAGDRERLADLSNRASQRAQQFTWETWKRGLLAIFSRFEAKEA